VSFREFNRNADIVNMDNSVNTPFYVETVIIIDPFFGCNNTPVLLNPPIDDACVGVTYLHNAGAIDADGDSLSYEFTIPKQDQDIPVINYRFPDDHDVENYNAQNEDQSGQLPSRLINEQAISFGTLPVVRGSTIGHSRSLNGAKLMASGFEWVM
jgi:hypothetical protein